MPVEVFATNIEHHDAPASDFLVERREAGETSFTILLFSHTGKYAETAENELQDCNLIAVEQPGHNSGQRRRDHDSAPRADEALSDVVHRLADGQKRRGILLDIHQDDPNYPVVLAARQEQHNFMDSAITYQPTATKRELLLRAAKATADSNEVRDQILQRQLSELPQKVGQSNVGVMLGAMHYRALRGLGGVDDTDRLAHTIHQSLIPFDRIIEAIRDNKEVSEDLLNRAILWVHYAQHRMPMPAEETLSPDLSVRLLSQIDDIAASTDSWQDKNEQIGSFLHEVTEMLRQSE